MPLTAIATIAGKVSEIDITDYAFPKIDLLSTELFCPECGDPMHIKHTELRIAHFAHNPRVSGNGTNCSLSSGESPEHRELKVKIRDWMRIHRLYRDCKFKFEYDIAGIRRADVVAIFPDLTIEAHEIQLSPISLETIVQRTQDYERNGIDLFWWLGRKAIKNEIRIWLYEHGIRFGTLTFGNTSGVASRNTRDGRVPAY